MIQNYLMNDNTIFSLQKIKKLINFRIATLEINYGGAIVAQKSGNNDDIRIMFRYQNFTL